MLGLNQWSEAHGWLATQITVPVLLIMFCDSYFYLEATDFNGNIPVKLGGEQTENHQTQEITRTVTTKESVH